MLRNSGSAAILLFLATGARGQLTPPPSITSLVLVDHYVPTAPYKFESTIQQTTQANQSVTVSGTFYLLHQVLDSLNNDPSWSFPFNEGIQDYEVEVNYNISATSLDSGKSYWARL